MSHELSVYLLGAAIVWTAIFLASAFVLSGTRYFAELLPILSAGAVWFVVFVPATWPKDAGQRGNV